MQDIKAFLGLIPNQTGTRLKISKHVAKQILQRNVANRRESTSYIDKLKNYMNNGQWHMTGDTIKFDDEFNLIDGQTRMRAFVESNLDEIEFIFFTGVNSNAAISIDTGRKRTASHTLEFHKIPNSTYVPSISKLIMGYRKGTIKRQMIDNYELLNFVKTNNDAIQEAASKGKSYYNKNQTLLTGSLFGALYFLFSEKSESQAEAFFDQLCSGVGLFENSPILTLRNRLTKHKGHLRHESSQKITETMNLVIHAWNKYRKNEYLKNFKYVENQEFLKIE